MKRINILLFAIMVNASLMYASDINIDGVLYEFNSSSKTATVTYLGTSYSAYSNEYTGSVSIPESVVYNGVTYAVTKIGTAAFRACTGLTSISIANGVTSIGDYAFYGCSGLTSITLGNSVTTISSNAFTGCKISSINYTSSIDNWCSKAWKPTVMASNYNLKINDVLQTTLTLPQSITTICSYAFSGCTSITSITIPEGVTSIGTYAFSSCKNLKTVSLPNTITSISQGTFKSSGVQSIDLPCSVKTIGEEAFSSCTALQNINLSQTRTIGNYAFRDCSAIPSLNIPKSISSIGTNAFGGCIVLKNVYFNAQQCNDFIDGSPFYDIRDVITSFEFGEEVKSVPSRICEEMSKLSRIFLPKNVTSVHAMAFSGCSNVETIRLGNKINTVQSMAFYGLSSLTDVYIRNSVPCVLNNNGFQNVDVSSVNLWVPCGAKTAYQEASNWQNFGNIEEDYKGEGTCGSAGDNLTWKLCGGQLVVSGQGDMDNYSNTPAPWKTYRDSIEEIVIEEGVTSIGDYAFSECANVTSVSLPNSVTYIGEDAFYNCSSLTSIDIPNSVTSIGGEAFIGCSSLTSVSIPNSVASIGWSAFSGEFGSCLTSVIIGNNITSLEYETFAYTHLASMIIPNGVISIGEAAFRDCNKLISVTIPRSVSNIDEYAFEECSSLTVIHNNAVIPQIINSNVFEHIDKTSCALYVPAESVNLYKTADVWKDFNIQAFWSSSCIIASGICGAEGDNLKWELSCDSILSISGIGKMADYESSAFAPWYSNHQSIKSVIIENGVTNIGNEAFDGCRGLNSVLIPNSVTKIGTGAFANCSSLTSVTIPSSVINIGSWAYSGCTELLEIVVESGNPKYYSADGVLFSSNKGLITYPDSKRDSAYVLPSGIEWFEPSDAFMDAKYLQSISLPASVHEFYEEPFTACPNLKYVHFNWTSVPQNWVGYAPMFESRNLPYMTLYIPCGASDLYLSGDFIYECTQFGTVIEEGCHIITWANYDGTILEVDSLAEGALPNYQGETPHKTATTEYAYAFIGWEPNIVPATDDVTYIAKYDSINVSCLFSSESYGVCDTCENTSIIWALSCDSVLTIKGMGKMADYSSSFPAPWNAYSSIIREIVIAEGISSIGNRAFKDCSSLISVNMPTSVKSIGLLAFRGCVTLPYLYIPDSVTQIGSHALYRLDSLALIDVAPANPVFSSVEGVLLNKHQTKLIQCPENKWGAYSIPETVVAIDREAFEHCTKLSSINISSSVDTIGIDAFLGCTNLSTMECKAITPPALSSSAFYGLICSQIQLYVPFTSLEAYRTADQWKEFDIRAYDKQCIITWKNYDGTILAIDTVSGGLTPQYNGEPPTKPSDTQYSYVFNRWSPTIKEATEDKIYTATYTKIVNKYAIVFNNYDNTELCSDSIAYGSVPEYSGNTPTKPATEKYIYAFIGWSPEIVPVTSNAIYTAIYDSTQCEPVIINYYNGDNLLQTKSVNLCEPTNYKYDGSAPISCDASSTYFIGWTKNQYVEKQSLVNPIKLDSSVNSVLSSERWEDQDHTWLLLKAGYGFTDGRGLQITGGKNASAITRNSFANISSVRVVYCTNTSNGGGTITISINGISQTLNTNGHSTSPQELIYNFENKLPSGQVLIDASATSNSIYVSKVIISFKDLYSVINDNVNNFYALFGKQVPNTSVITFSSADFSEIGTAGTGSELSTDKEDISLYLDKGYAGNPLRSYSDGILVFSSSIPLQKIVLKTNTSKGNANKIRRISGGGSVQRTADSLTIIWEGLSTNVKFQVSAHVQFAEIAISKAYQYSDYMTHCPIPNSYAIRWLNYDEVCLRTDSLSEGEIPEYQGATPTKPATPKYTYTFTGWSPEIIAVTGDATYIAQYDSTLIEYEIHVTPEGGSTEGGTVTIDGDTNYGETVTLTPVPEDGYVFEGWSDGNTDNPREVVVDGDVNVYPIFVKKQYLIRFVNFDGSVLQNDSLEHGAMPEYTETTPEKPASAKYTYSFREWQPAIVAAISDATYTAQFDSTLIEYEIHVIPEGGSTEGGSVEVTGTPTYGETIILTPVPEDGYVFEGWSDGNTDNPREVVVDGDVNIYPIFHKCEEIITLTEIVIGKGESYEFGGKTYTARGIYYDTITLANGCDSISVLKLSVTKKKTFNLRVVVDSTQLAWGTATGSGIYNDGQTVTIEAIPSGSKYVFARWWNPDEGIEIFENPYTFTLTRNLTVKAVFKRAPKRIVVKQQGASHAMSHVETDIVAVIEVGEKMATVSNTSESAYRIYDSAGHLIITSAEDNTYALPSGLYFIHIDGESEKFIIQ